MPPTHYDRVIIDDLYPAYNDPFTELDSQVLEPLPVQRASISTETGAEAQIVFPDDQEVSVAIQGAAVVTIEIPARPKPETVNISVSLTMVH